MDLSPITSLTAQIAALRAQIDVTTDPTAKAVLAGQLSMLEAELTQTAQHMQAQADSSNSILNGLGLFSVLQGLVGTSAPTVLNLFKA